MHYEELTAHVAKVIRSTLKLGDDVVLAPKSDLVNEIGIDSIEAFEAVATLHELIGVRIPDDIEPKSFASIQAITDYLVDTYEEGKIEAFTRMDIESRLEALNASGDVA